MRDAAKNAISRLGARLGERRQKAKDGERPALTGDDEINITEFSRLVQGTIDLLRVENEALVTGDVEKVAACYGPKSELLKSLSLRQPLIEPFLRERTEGIDELRSLIRTLAEHLSKNSTLLEGMASASRAIVSEVEAIRKRQSLDGIYDKKGAKRRDLEIWKGGFARKI